MKTKQELKAMKLSFIIPVYNAEKYLSRCLDSLLNQDENDYEIICLNDGSKDSSLSLLNDYSKKFPEKFNIISQENQGIGPARNNAFKAVKGEYTWFIDNDDCIHPNCLKEIFSLLNKYKPDILNISHIYDYFENNPFPEKLTESLDIKKISQPFAMYFYQDAPWSKIYNSEFLRKNKMEFKNVFGEDTCTTFDLYSKTKNIYLIEKPLYAWIERKTSFSHEIYTKKHMETFPTMIETLKIQSEKAPKELRTFYECLMQAKAFHFLNLFNSSELPDDLKKVRENCCNKTNELLKDLPENIYYEIKKRDEILYDQLWHARKRKEQEIKDSYENTISWKLTKPVRMVKKIIKGNR